jgi:light-regulated signal transduction histidine kinase (bacteriophytochrome)
MHEQSSKIMTRKNALRSRFISDLADNFKAPLDELYELSKKVPGAHVFAEKARDVEDMFVDLMSLAMAEAGSSSLDLRLVDLSEMMEDLLQNAEQKAVRKSVEIESDFAKDVFVEADEERFRQMLSFAVSAMINLTYRGGVLGVSLKKQKKNDFSVVRINFNPHIVLHDMEAPGTVFFGAGASLMLALVGMHGGQITFEKSGKFVSVSLIFPLEN